MTKSSLCDESFEKRREWMECATKVRHGVKELEDINGELYYLREKLTENHKKKGEAYQRILKLKNLHHEEAYQLVLTWLKLWCRLHLDLSQFLRFRSKPKGLKNLLLSSQDNGFQ